MTANNWQWSEIRREVIRRTEQGAPCPLCGDPLDKGQRFKLPNGKVNKLSLVADHIVPRSAGGSDELSNLRAAHWGCNQKRWADLPWQHSQQRLKKELQQLDRHFGGWTDEPSNTAEHSYIDLDSIG